MQNAMKTIHNIKNLFERRKELRNNSTPQEILLWLKLKNSQLGFKFRRQHSIGGYIADFYCPVKRLVIEIDGFQHFEKENEEYDKIRSNYFEGLDIKVLRFTNAEINTNMNGVLLKIVNELKMENYKGVIIEESLENKDVLKHINILSTKIEQVIEKHKTPWLKQWTLDNIEISESEAENVALEISKSLESKHSWYADFKNKTTHFIIFRNKIFKIDRTNKDQYDEAKEYGISLYIPPYQVDFHPEIKMWER